MATVNSNTVSLTLTSTWTCTWADDDHNSTYVSKASNTDAQAANFSATIPAGSTINSMYLRTTWSNTGVVQTASVDDSALGASVDVRAVSTWAHTYKWRASAAAMSSQGSYSRYMYVSAYISVDYTPPTAASVWSVLLDSGAGTIYAARARASTLHGARQTERITPLHRIVFSEATTMAHGMTQEQDGTGLYTRTEHRALSRGGACTPMRRMAQTIGSIRRMFTLIVL